MGGTDLRNADKVSLAAVAVRRFLPTVATVKKLSIFAPLLVLAVLAAPSPAPVSAASRIAPAAPGALEFAGSDLTPLQWALDAIDARSAWSVSRGAGVTVAVIDDGFDLMHREFNGRVPFALVQGEDGFTRVAASEVPVGYGHGTHVAGIVAAAADGSGISGVAPDVTLLPVALTENVDDEVIADAIVAAVEAGARVVNLSLGSASDTDGKVCAAVGYASARDVVVVAAAGNGNAGNARMYPAACPDVVAVASSDTKMRPSEFTSFDTTVWVSAPGTDVLSAVPTSLDPLGYFSMSGTSMAAPLVAGVAALIRAASPSYDAAAVRGVLAATATDVLRAGRDEFSGFGVVNAARAVGLVSAVSATSMFVVLAPYLIDRESLAMAGVTTCSGCSRLTWSPPQYDEVSSYTLRRFRRDGTVTDTSLVAPSVRVDFPSLAAGEYVQLIAHTAAGELRSLPLAESSREGELGEVTAVRAHWTRSGKVKVTWTNPADAAEVTAWSAVLMGGQTISAIQNDGPPPTEIIFTDEDFSPTDDLVVMIILSDGFDETSVLSNELAARIPSQVLAIPAGRTHAYVYVAVSALNCAKLRGGCAGRQVTVKIKWGTAKRATVRTYRTVLTREGEAFVLVPTSARLKVLRVSHTVAGFRSAKAATFEKLVLRPSR